MVIRKEIFNKSCQTIILILLIFSILSKPLIGYRPLEGELKPASDHHEKVPLQRGPVPPSQPSSCTYIGYPVVPGHDRHCEIHG
ncbi:hypothetical protein L484_005745 [Morus notabilis]|uniref:Uncharacterized protein n=1 Tax=Morus notabilis TaxID=981085 RepID=W9RM92_9ROSA|nr:hypothetical protein L484_005745 [Morus notabilis]